MDVTYVRRAWYTHTLRPTRENGLHMIPNLRVTLDVSALKSRRLMAGLTQVALAAKVGVHPITMVRYETGAITPRPDTLNRLAKALDCQIADIAKVTDGQPDANAVGA